MRSWPSAEGAARDVGGQIERHRQHEAEIVVGVLADQVDAAGRAITREALACVPNLARNASIMSCGFAPCETPA